MLIKFVKYNNLLPIVLMLVFLGASLSLANETVQEGLLRSEEIVRAIDNSYIINVNLTKFDARLKITGITETSEYFDVTYTYNSIALENYIWRDVVLAKSLRVSKTALGGDDLGLFVAEQLGQMLGSELAYFRQAQTLERAKGRTQKIVSTQYAGLIGSLLDPKDETFAGYVPVIKEATEAEPEPVLPLNEQPESERSKSIAVPVSVPLPVSPTVEEPRSQEEVQADTVQVQG